MKGAVVLAVLFVVAAVANGDHEMHLNPMIGEQIKACAEELHIDEGMFHDFMRHKEGVDEKQVGCLKACMLKKNGAMVDSKIIIEKVQDFIEKVHAEHPEHADKLGALKDLAVECVNKANAIEDECEKSVELMKCYHEGMRKLLD